jgi:FkbM family methyltransferase
MKSIIKLLLHKVGFDISLYPGRDVRRRFNILKELSINHVLDVGANSGQYAVELFDLGYCGRISSFEPLPEVFIELEKKCRLRSNWRAYNYALGSENKTSLIYESLNSVSSSLSNMLETHLANAPESRVIATKEIRIKKSADAIAECCNILDDRIYLKIDTQGYEEYVLEGIDNYFDNICAVQLEISLTQLYEDGMNITEAIKYFERLGFELYSIENGFEDLDNLRLLQVDLIFVKLDLQVSNVL